jgi:hypothetical protein
MKTSFLIGLILCGAGLAAAAESEPSKNSRAAETTAAANREKILAEIKTLPGHEWAGEYYAGDGLGVNTSLAIAPDSGYVFEWHGCLGLYDRNYGGVTLADGRVHLSFTFENERKGFQGIAPEFIPVSWGPRHYLIAADEVVDFCNSVNDGGEARKESHGSYFLRRGDEKKAVTGRPKLPAEYEAYLLEKPIRATITEVGGYTTRPSVASWKFKDTPVVLDAGSAKGLRVGMKLAVTDPRNSMEDVRITGVESERAQGLMTQIGEELPGPKVGWRLSTRAPWHSETRDDFRSN